MNDFQAVEEAVQQYFVSTYKQDLDGVRAIFHPDAHLAGVIDGKQIHLTLEDFVKRVASQGQDYPLNKITKIISVCGDIAHAEAYVQVGNRFFTDYLSLLKVDGKWVIRHKAFVAE